MALRARLDREKTYLLSLLGNQALLEHEAFTDLLWAVTHLAEELHVRGDFDGLPATDRAHLVVDVKRAYTQLGVQWIDYLRHLQTQYPFLFSLAVRTNPLDPRRGRRHGVSPVAGAETAAPGRIRRPDFGGGPPWRGYPLRHEKRTDTTQRPGAGRAGAAARRCSRARRC